MISRLSLPPLFAVVVLGFLTAELTAQGLVINGWYDCQRATNGRTYCKRQGTSTYQPVAEEFFRQYEAARTGVAVPTVVPVSPPTVVATEVTTSTNVLVVNLMSEAADIRGQIQLLTKILEQQTVLRTTTQEAEEVDETIRVINDRLRELKENFRDKTVSLSKYQTSIKPDDADQQITARRESEIFTKIPYYIPGTKETGEFWVEPIVSDSGELIFKFQFVDVGSRAANKVRSTIDMRPGDLEKVKWALVKTAKNSKLAHEKKVRRKLDVRLECFPAADCPPEGQKIAHRSSSEIIFSINEDGATSARIQRNKGLFEEGYNVSIGSARLLQAYINHVLIAGRSEHEMGSTSTDELKAIFR